MSPRSGNEIIRPGKFVANTSRERRPSLIARLSPVIALLSRKFAARLSSFSDIARCQYFVSPLLLASQTSHFSFRLSPVSPFRRRRRVPEAQNCSSSLAFLSSFRPHLPLSVSLSLSLLLFPRSGAEAKLLRMLVRAGASQRRDVQFRAAQSRTHVRTSVYIQHTRIHI